MQIVKRIRITNRAGLHARPAAVFVQKANKFSSEITLTKEDQTVNGKSIMGILMLAAEKGSEVEIKVEGEDAESAAKELIEVLISDVDSSSGNQSG